MRFHLLSLPHTQTTSEYLTCAYTQKVVKFTNMMTERGHEVYLYAGEQNEAECSELIPLITEEERAGWFGKGFDTVKTPFEWDASTPYWRAFNSRAISALIERLRWDEDIILMTTGWPQYPIVQALGVSEGQRPVIACEWAIGYEGICTEFCAFESHAWMHHVYGLRNWRNGRFYDTVVPNYFDARDFHLSAKHDYLLFVGRLVQRKGPIIAAMIAERVGLPLYVAGPGGSIEDGKIVAPEVTLSGDVHYVGEVGIKERARLMAGARALICPTLYIEPFGGVAVEAMLSGTPVIATDFGAFTETVEPGTTGYRFSTLAEGVARTLEAMNGMATPEQIRARALERYSFDAVAPQFESWFERLLGLWGPGWGA